MAWFGEGWWGHAEGSFVRLSNRHRSGDSYVVTHILVPHCCTRNYYFVVVWLNQEGEPSLAEYYQFKTEAMERFPVAAAPGKKKFFLRDNFL